MSEGHRSRRKQRTREHVIADLSYNHVERLILLCGFVSERPVHDYGFDMLMLTYDGDGRFENGGVWIQLKATDHFQPHADGRTAPFVVEAADLSLWLFDPFPVILIRYDAVAERAYWLDIQDHANRETIDIEDVGESITLKLPLAKVWNPDSIRGIAVRKNERLLTKPSS